MDKQIVVGIIGCGRISEIAHFPALSKIGGVRIKYACDIILAKAEAAKAKYPALVEKTTADYREVVADKEVDAVYVLTPNYAHYEITMAALEAGKHVFCEKPITVNYKMSQEMMKKAEQNGKILAIGVCNRYNNTVEALEEMNRRGDFGKIYHVCCSFRSYRSIPGLGGAFTDKSKSGGGVLIDWGVHFLDLIMYVLGGAEIKTVTCDTYCEIAKDIGDYKYVNMWAENTSDKNGVNDVEDFVSGYVRTDKAGISFNGAWAQNIGNEEMYIDFLGDKGGARMDYFGKFEFYDARGGMLRKIIPNYNMKNHYESEDEAFVKAVKNGGDLRNSVDKVMETSKLLDALYLSAKEKREIEIE